MLQRSVRACGAISATGRYKTSIKGSTTSKKLILVRFASTDVAARKKVVLLGSGWSTYTLLTKIDRKAYDVVVVSPRNHFLFTPLLASTTTGTLDFRSIIEPIRTARNDVRYYQASCEEIDFDGKKLICREVYNPDINFEVDYDKLVIGVGAENATFGIPGVREHAYFLKELSDARAIRQKIIANFEEASIPNTSFQERKRLLNFVVVGGGPTGVETAAELADFFWEDLGSYYPEIQVHEVRITLLEAGHTILSAFNRKLVAQAMKTMRKQGIDLLTDNSVAEVRKDAVVLKDGSVIPCGLVVWSTGVAPRPLVKKLNVPKTPQGRIIVDDHLRVQTVPDVFAIGDCCEITGMPLPATAQVASQQGAYLAQTFNKESEGIKAEPFKFHFLGLMTYVGHYKSILDTNTVSGTGFLEWLAWRSVYLTRLGSWKNKFQVPFNWLRTFIWGRDVTNF